jgi:hypothetical protein
LALRVDALQPLFAEAGLLAHSASSLLLAHLNGRSDWLSSEFQNFPTGRSGERCGDWSDHTGHRNDCRMGRLRRAGLALGNAIHFAQDQYSPSHQGQEWHGFGEEGVLGTAEHVLQDTFPGWQNLRDAYDRTSGIIQGSRGVRK